MPDREDNVTLIKSYADRIHQAAAGRTSSESWDKDTIKFMLTQAEKLVVALKDLLQ